VPEDDGDEDEEPTPYVVASFEGAQPVRDVRVEGDARAKTSFTSQDFLGLGAHAAVKEAARATLEAYTVGSCGPRGFYGTTRKHLELESGIAGFMRAEESITYSDATATIVSAIAAFAKRGDVLLVDQRANYGILSGARLSRSKVTLFRHNDMQDLRRKLEDVREADRRLKGTAAQSLALQTRRFIVVEGIYAATGDLCPLDKVAALASEYKWRIIVDDSWGFGVLGATGRGATEHFAPRAAAAAAAAAGGGGAAGGAAAASPPLLDVAVLVGSLSTTLASVGGFCVGTREVVDHQRLSGQGYCFSASAPPFTCATATAALEQMAARPALVAQLRAKCEFAQRELEQSFAGLMRLTSDPISPVKHLVFPPPPAEPVSPGGSAGDVGASFSSGSGSSAAGGVLPSRQQLERQARAELAAAERRLDRVVREACATGNVLVSRSHSTAADATSSPPSLRLMVTALHSEAELRAAARALAAAVRAVLAREGK